MDRRVQYGVDDHWMCHIIASLERESYGIFLCIGVCFASFSILVLFFSVSECVEWSDVFCLSFHCTLLCHMGYFILTSPFFFFLFLSVFFFSLLFFYMVIGSFFFFVFLGSLC